MKKNYPEGYRLPTPDTLKQHDIGRQQGLVPAGSLVLRQPADTVIGIQGNKQVLQIDHRLRKVAANVGAAGYPVEGLHAVQIGESARVAIVPHPTKKGQWLTVINGSIEEHVGAKMAH